MVHHCRAQAVGRSGNHAQHQTKQRGAEGDDKAPPTVGAAPLSSRLSTSRPRSSVPRKKETSPCATTTAATAGSRGTAGRCRRGEPAAENAEQQQARAAVQTDHRRGVAIELTPYGAQRAGGRFPDKRYRRAYESF